MSFFRNNIWKIVFKNVFLSSWALEFCYKVRDDPIVRSYITESVHSKIYEQKVKSIPWSKINK